MLWRKTTDDIYKTDKWVSDLPEMMGKYRGYDIVFHPTCSIYGKHYACRFWNGSQGFGFGITKSLVSAKEECSSHLTKLISELIKCTDEYENKD